MRRQHLFVQVHNKLFLGPNGRHMETNDVLPLEDIRELGGEPLVVIGLTDEASHIKTARLTSLSAPQSISSAVLEMWRDDQGLRGIPDVVVVHPDLARSAAPAMVWIRNLGIAVEERSGRDRRHEANRRAMLDFVKAAGWWSDGPKSRTLGQLRAALAKYTFFFHTDPYHQCATERENWAIHMALPFRAPPDIEPLLKDWEPGSWCELGFRSAISPTDLESLRRNHHERHLIEVVSEYSPDTYQVDDVLCAWPEPLRTVARVIDTNERDLRAWLRGRVTLTLSQESDLRHYLGFHHSDYHSDYPWSPDGPYLLVPKTVSAATRAWDCVSHGGDLDFARTIYPSDAPRPVEQMVLFEACGGYPSILWWTSTPRLTSKQLINLDLQGYPEEVPDHIYGRWRALVELAITQPKMRHKCLRALAKDEPIFERWSC